MIPRPILTNPRTWVFLTAVACAMLFALATQHAWEDYYITYRASKNLATGHGLVFNVGDRLHTFTSPLGVLLPALASLLTFNSSDDAALWLFRGMSSLAFGGAALLLFATARRTGFDLITALLAVAALCTDVKSVDFTINGMETGFMLLFLAYSLWALLAPGPGRRALHLGLAWGGLMWTRPDSFIYIGLLAVAAWAFNRRTESGLTRREMAVVFLRAGMICTVVYLPWFLGAWAYYGSPIPHTIVAKASVSPGTTHLSGILLSLVRTPLAIWNGTSTIEATFLPAYYIMGGWPQSLLFGARVLGTIAAFVWLLPFVRMGSRAASFAYLGAHLYLSYFPYFPFPWYIPPTALLAFFALAGLFDSVLGFTASAPRWKFAGAFAGAAAGLMLLAQAWTLCASARQLAAFQAIIDSGNRRSIGEWLARNARPGDSVFLEPLGYIGFYSGLKTFDWPGLSSREVVAAHQKVGAQWSAIIDYLNPDWLVLRPTEVDRLNDQMPELLSTSYKIVKDFDVRSQVDQLHVRGRSLLEIDARFIVYQRQHPKYIVAEAGTVKTRYPGPVTLRRIDNLTMRLIHAPGSWAIPIPHGAQHLQVAFAFPPDAYTGEPRTTGATFQIAWSDGRHQEILLQRELNPAKTPGDRGAHSFECILPTAASGEALLVLRTLPGESDTKDWTCWTTPHFW